MRCRRYIFVALAALAAPVARAVVERTGERTGELTRPDGARIAYRVVEPPEAKAAVVVLPGYSESYVYYDELLADFAQKGYAAYVMDLRGMGLSARLAANRQVAHVARFDDYVDDATAFLDEVVAREKDGRKRPLHLFAHSTGGLVAARLLARRPDAFRAAALSAPLFEVETGAWPSFVAALAVKLATALGYGQSYAPGYGDQTIARYVFETNRTTHSRERFEAQLRTIAARPDLIMGGPSNGWVSAVLAATAEVTATAPKVTTPVLLLQAGQDAFAAPGGQETFCHLAPRCRLVRFPAAYHELVRETDAVRKPVLDEVFAHFEAAPAQN